MGTGGKGEKKVEEGKRKGKIGGRDLTVPFPYLGRLKSLLAAGSH